jgi:Pyruvate/2-oxoacid:ferredoxin oxidoreductase delta subunit
MSSNGNQGSPSRRALLRFKLDNQPPTLRWTAASSVDGPPDVGDSAAGSEAEPAAERQVAWVDRSHCLSWRGTFCMTCAEHCPEEAGIRLNRGRPIVDESVCTGCARCRDVCPAPRKAIVMRPAPRLSSQGDT